MFRSKPRCMAMVLAGIVMGGFLTVAPSSRAQRQFDEEPGPWQREIRERMGGREGREPGMMPAFRRQNVEVHVFDNYLVAVRGYTLYKIDVATFQIVAQLDIPQPARRHGGDRRELEDRERGQRGGRRPRQDAAWDAWDDAPMDR